MLFTLLVNIYSALCRLLNILSIHLDGLFDPYDNSIISRKVPVFSPHAVGHTEAERRAQGPWLLKDRCYGSALAPRGWNSSHEQILDLDLSGTFD